MSDRILGARKERGEEEEEEAGRNEASSVENRSGNLHACCLAGENFRGH